MKEENRDILRLAIGISIMLIFGVAAPYTHSAEKTLALIANIAGTVGIYFGIRGIIMAMIEWRKKA